MSETVRRVLRTFAALLAGLAVAVPTAAAAAGIPAAEAAEVAGWFVAAGILATAVLNALEDRGHSVPGVPRR